MALNGAEGDVDCGAQTAVVLDVSAGYDHTCVIVAGGRVKCFGNNTNGQLGQGDVAPRASVDELGEALPAIDLPEPSVAVHAGVATTCAISEGRRVFCWGDNRAGQLGRGDNVEDVGSEAAHMGAALRPVALPENTAVDSICLGQSHACGPSSAGEVFCWGQNNRGQLGYSDRATRGLTQETMAERYSHPPRRLCSRDWLWRAIYMRPAQYERGDLLGRLQLRAARPRTRLPGG